MPAAIWRKPARAIAVLVLAALLAVSACTSEQAVRWLAVRGDRQAQADHHLIVNGYGDRIPAARWTHYDRMARLATAWWGWALSEAGRNAAADHHARSNGAPGTCSETGIFLAESGGNWQARNSSSSAAGGYQYLSSTWAGYGGYASASDAPPYVQHERFHQTWANGAGRSHWAASVC